MGKRGESCAQWGWLRSRARGQSSGLSLPNHLACASPWPDSGSFLGGTCIFDPLFRLRTFAVHVWAGKSACLQEWEKGGHFSFHPVGAWCSCWYALHLEAWGRDWLQLFTVGSMCLLHHGYFIKPQTHTPPCGPLTSSFWTPTICQALTDTGHRHCWMFSS